MGFIVRLQTNDYISTTFVMGATMRQQWVNSYNQVIPFNS